MANIFLFNDLHDILTKLLDSPRFHRFVRVTNARIKGEPIPPPPQEDDGYPSPMTIRMRKVRVFMKLFAEEFKNVLRGKN